MVNFPCGYKYFIPAGLRITDFNLKSPNPMSRTGQNIYSQARTKDHKSCRDGIFKFNDRRSASWFCPILSRPDLRSKMSKPKSRLFFPKTSVKPIAKLIRISLEIFICKTMKRTIQIRPSSGTAFVRRFIYFGNAKLFYVHDSVFCLLGFRFYGVQKSYFGKKGKNKIFALLFHLVDSLNFS